jgi:hypothetical protein
MTSGAAAAAAAAEVFCIPNFILFARKDLTSRIKIE